MKNFKYLGVIILLLNSCVDLTENMITDTVADVQFSTPEGIDEALIGAYQPLRWFYGREPGMLMNLYGTDLFQEGQSYNSWWDSYGPGLNASTRLEPSGDVLVWEHFYRGINYANTVISRAESIIIDQNQRNLKIAEARFLRAHYYFVLVQHFGAIHLTLEETRGVELEAFRTPVDEIYEAIILDLAYASEHLPIQQVQYGRPTKYAAINHLAKVYLTIQNWEKAAALAIEVISEGPYQLLANYADIFDPFNQRHSEVIWSVQWGDNPEVNNPGNELQRFFSPRQWLLAGLIGDDTYHVGIARFWPTDYALTELFGNDYRTMELNIRNDSRYQATFKEVWEYNDAPNIPAGKSIGDTAAWFTNDPIMQELTDAQVAALPYRLIRIKDRNDVFSPAVQKHRYPYLRNNGRDYMYMRLGETYLIAAEALMMQGKLNEAASYFNAVRARAAFSGASIPLITPEQLNIDQILDERGRELAGELHRWTDLKRTGKLLERVRKHNPNAAPNIREYHQLRPIPQTQIDRTQNEFGQNPGY
ncbi:RagB/SusD family nutrient uptake outer membrane protein [Belliella sp. DSM 111904]|uniref:RagB/SusD family nutrient uptake outer membrane protein n=1 Tax=Belliella filtrata TaxID=2923435 RepID=A0ABS9V365_9BACT|nr:RagB/SusD family nutrient uptake outer membrane protein [Belliella filtrata]MCH7410440.1 RagB/SusD family nutrient uptake outer membrane protein [Belliella filtrata]